MNNYFLKCDISGIQSFIFNVPGKGAAKELKKRSKCIQNISEECLQAFKMYFENDKIEELYNGGGNFYLKITTNKTESDLSNFIKTITKERYLQWDIYPYINFINEEQLISQLLNDVNKKVQKTKLQRPVIYEKFDNKVPELQNKSIKGINGQVPKDENGDILDFDRIAELSEGDKKIAGLKLDVDNLGKLFQNRAEDDYKKLSRALKEFFDSKLLDMINEWNMQQNIYVVFSGGDDCFLIGCWNKIFELSIKLRQKFDVFQTDLKNKIPSLPKENITFSAGIIVIPPNYPMLRLAEEAEDALSSSKRAEKKNSVTLFGKTLSWKEFEYAQRIAVQLYDLIEKKGESKSLIERIKSSDIGFNSLQQNALNGKINLPKVWKLKYYLRNVKKENIKEIESLFDEYTKFILDAFMKHQSTNPDIYPVAARWAELLLKKDINL